MTDLASKFGGIEGQLADQHAELMAALNTIAFALGAPPTTPTTTLEDLATLLTILNTNLVALADANDTFHTAVLDTLGLINTNTDLLINNGSLNAQRLLIAIAANDPCKSCDVVPIEPPPIQVTPQTVDQEHCQRMQALIYALLRFTVKLDVISSFGLGFSPTVIRDAITEIITELGVSELLLYPSLGEVAQLAGAGAAYIVSNIFSSTSLPFEFQSISDELLTVLYDTDNASAGQSAYRSFLDGSGLDSTVKQLFKAMAYTSLFNLYYDSTNDVDVSGYDGTICAPEIDSCYHFSTSEMVEVTTETGSAIIPDWSKYSITLVNNPGHVNPVWIEGEFPNWTYAIVPGAADVYHEILGVGGTGSVATSGTMSVMGAITITFVSSTPFTLDFCPPEL